LPAYRTENGDSMPDYDSLIELIEKTIQPRSWDTVGGPASVQPVNGWSSATIADGSASVRPINSGNVQALVVNQTLQAHSSIANLLDELRKQRKTPLTKEEIDKLPVLPNSGNE
jgi:hypothetical protein